MEEEWAYYLYLLALDALFFFIAINWVNLFI